MYMNASILDAQVGGFFDGVEVNLYDLDEKETYKGLITDGLVGLADLRQLKKQNQPLEVLQEAASRVELPPVMQPVPVYVRRVKVNKGFMKLVCRMAVEQ
jgi:hypothetical protein